MISFLSYFFRSNIVSLFLCVAPIFLLYLLLETFNFFYFLPETFFVFISSSFIPISFIYALPVSTKPFVFQWFSFLVVEISSNQLKIVVINLFFLSVLFKFQQNSTLFNFIVDTILPNFYTFLYYFPYSAYIFHIPFSYFGLISFLKIFVSIVSISSNCSAVFKTKTFSA